MNISHTFFIPTAHSHQTFHNSPEIFTVFLISELYLDGNSIECEGLIELIKMVVDKSEQEAIERRAEKEAKQLLDESAVKGGGLLGVRTGMSTMRPGSALSSAGRLIIVELFQYQRDVRSFQSGLYPLGKFLIFHNDIFMG